MNEEIMLYKQQAAEEYFGSLLVYTGICSLETLAWLDFTARP
jgi:hypothetical protein